jgi:hypothetical protein
MPKIMIRGDLLPLALQSEMRRCYVHRFTRDHVPAWARKPMPNGGAYPVQYDSDAQWLARTLFPVITDKKGAVKRSAAGDCWSHPYWPDGVPEGQNRLDDIPTTMEA